MRVAILAALLVCGAAHTAAAAPKYADDAVWLTQPTPEEFAKAATPEVVAKGGRALIVCRADAQGFTSDCRTLAEAPTGRGLSSSLLGLASKYRLRPEQVKQAAPDGWVIIRKSWYTADTPPDWRRRPTSEDLMAVWPTKAMAAGYEGEAVLDCLITVTGSLSNCVGIELTPGGAGFDAAALAMAAQFNMRPARTNGQPVVTDVVIPLHFRWPGGRPRGAEVPSGSPVIAPTMAWAEAPSHEDIAAAYPIRAREGKIAGLASMLCRLAKDGRLTDCQITRADPRNSGFGEAAKVLAKRFRTNPLRQDGASLKGGEVHLRVNFDPRVLGEPGTAPFGSTSVVTAPPSEAVQAAQAANQTGSVAGRAVISCMVAAGGRLDQCKVVSEDPAGVGLGATALALKSEFRVATWSEEGLPVVGRSIRVPVRFENTQTAEGSAPPKP